MATLETDAIVLHAFDYLETSRILRLATRDAGVQSVVARGAKNSRKRFGSALDLFADGRVEVQLKPGRDLHTLLSFDVARSRSPLAEDLGRFSAAAAFAECVGRVVHEEPAPSVFECVIRGFDRIEAAEHGTSVEAGLGAFWQLLAEIGFAPAIDRCASCHAPINPGESAIFSHVVGGALCTNCGALTPGGRTLPASALEALRQWLLGDSVRLPDAAAERAHQRLLREFMSQHLPDSRGLPAYSVWEGGSLGR